MSGASRQPSSSSRGGEADQASVAYPGKLRELEHGLLRKRRGLDPAAPLGPLAGFGLSGGGIRSATFALGLFQGLAARKGLLRQIDYLSTVSGGGYFGSFFGRLLTRPYVSHADDVEEILLGRKKPEVLAFLRENGRYLSPNGAGDSLLFGAVLLRNWVSILVVLGFFVLAMLLGLQTLRGVVDLWFSPYLGMQEDALIWWSPLLWLPLLTFAVAAFPIGWAYWLVESKPIEEGDPKKPESAVPEVSAISPVAGVLLVLVLSVLLAVFTWGEEISLLWASVAAVAILTLFFWRLALRAVRKDHDMDKALYQDQDVRYRLGRWLTAALLVTGLLLALALVDSIGQSLYAVLEGGSTLGAWLTAVFSSLGVLAGFGRWIAMFFSKGPKGVRPSLPMKLVATVAAVLLVLLLLVSLDTASHAITWGLGKPQGAPVRLIAEDEKDERVVEVRGSSGPRGVNLRIRSGTPDAGQAPESAGESRERDLGLAFLGFAVTLLLSLLFGQTWPFVNRSSHQPLYGARLTRAYLGASNEKRWKGLHSLTEPLEGDDLDLARYWPPPTANGAPIHLINVTINETIDGQSQVQQQDRKGVGMALGPWGLSAGIRHHLLLPLGDDTKMNPEGERIFEIYPQSGFRVFDYKPDGGVTRFRGEPLPLGAWLSISGAAFSTGTGFRTSMGMSLLAGFGNVRLGRWWDSGVVRDLDGASRKISLRLEDLLAYLFPVQTHLLDEFLARFPGTARRRWYLSDGGHFENMGGYELLRRRLRFIVIVDGEMDADYTFEGLANLVRKARIDFGAEVRFLTEEQLDEVVHAGARPYVGTLEQLRRGTWKVPEDGSRKGPHGQLVEAQETGLSLAHAALARVTYDSDAAAVSWLLYIKPTLTGREPVDLLEYHRQHPKFPHEPTIDQYFDEAQWESYRRLGQYIAEVLFGRLENLLPAGGRSQESLLADWNWKGHEAPEMKKGELPTYS